MLPVDPGKKILERNLHPLQPHKQVQEGEGDKECAKNSIRKMGNGEALQKGETRMGLYGLLGVNNEYRKCCRNGNRRAAVRGDMQKSDHKGTNQSSTVTP